MRLANKSGTGLPARSHLLMLLVGITSLVMPFCGLCFLVGVLLEGGDGPGGPFPPLDVVGWDLIFGDAFFVASAFWWGFSWKVGTGQEARSHLLMLLVGISSLVMPFLWPLLFGG